MIVDGTKSHGDNIRYDFSFAPPIDLPTSGKHGEDNIYWEIALRLPNRRELVFDFPMAEDALAASVHTPPLEPAPTASPIRSEVISGGLRFDFPSQRNRFFAVLLTAISMFMILFGYKLFDGFQHFMFATAWIFTAACYATSLIFLALGSYLAFHCFSVAISEQGVLKQSQWLMLHYDENIPSTDICNVRIHQNGTRNSGSGARVFYALKLVRRELAELEIADGIENYSSAQKVREQILAALKLNAVEETPQQDTQFKLPLLPWMNPLGRAVRWLKYIPLAGMIYDIANLLLKIQYFHI